MREIELTKGKVALVDDDDYERLNIFKWRAMRASSREYAVRSIRIDGKRKTVLMHREILQTTLEVDHRNLNGLDNRKTNLREATRQENGRNRNRQLRPTVSGYKGVRLLKAGVSRRKTSAWEAFIVLNRRQQTLGVFATKEDAAQAYNWAAAVHFGEFARFNEKAVSHG